MIFEGIKIGFALTGSFCTFESIIPQIAKLMEQGAEVIPIMSFNAYNMDTKFGKAEEHINKIKEITKKEIIHTIQDAEPIGPKKLVDIMVIAPCTGNTIAKLANDITDTPVTMAAKSSLRNGNSLVLGISTNNGLGNSAMNIGKLLNSKNVFFIPFRQDNPITKPNSLVFDKNYIGETIQKALLKEQIQPVLL
jgi:dipicolinate synthase subunit B